jgi:rod shape-determining protein MreC
MNRDKRAANFLLIGFGLASLVLLSMPLTGKVQAFRSLASYLFEPLPFLAGEGLQKLASLPPDVARMISADARVRAMEDELKETSLMRLEVDALRRENARLTEAVALSTSAPSLLCWARVAERDPQNWFRFLTVDAGADRGVEIDAPVLAPHGGRLAVVGRIVEVGERTSKVLLLTDELSAVAAYLPSSRWEGLAQGQGSRRILLNYLPVEASVGVGDEVATSPTSATFPPDLLIGTVSRVQGRDVFLAFQAAEVAVSVRPGAIQEVMILKRKRRAPA